MGYGFTVVDRSVQFGFIVVKGGFAIACIDCRFFYDVLYGGWLRCLDGADLAFFDRPAEELGWFP